MPGLPDHVKRLTLLACILGSGIAILDATIVNVALPRIEGDLAAQEWIVNAYALTLGALILVGGSLSDVLGHRRVFALGLAGFGLASAACAAAPGPGWLVAARAVQGCAAALLTPSALAVIVATFAPSERGAAIGTWTAWTGIAAVAGPLAGGALVAWTSWRWIFLVNVPLVALTLVLVLRFVAEPPRREGRRLDLAGAALAALGLAGPVFALVEQPRLGWGAPGVVVPAAAGAMFLAAFVVRERRVRDPMLPLDLFARHNFAVGNVETLAMYGGLAMLFFLLALFLQEVAGWPPTRAALMTLPTTLTMFALSRRFGALADRRGPRLFMGAGPLVAAAGLLLLVRVGRDADVAGDLLPALLVFSLGLSMTVAPLTATVLAGVEEREAGIASAVNNAVARIAGLLGVAALGPLVGRHLDVASFHLAMGAAAGLLAAAGILGALFIENPRRSVRARRYPGGPIEGAPHDAAGPSPETGDALTPAS